ncbi:MAG: response regulator [Crocinitomicaceae bacterium]|nr:response regulator [Flavobacteriales bacterium]NQZ37981.1 response regulator [Crocinitomicaceae bacterium]
MKKSKNKIFIVEDDQFYAEIIRNTLLNEGFTDLEVFESGSECISNLDHKPNIIILDHMLGQMSGISVLKKVKSWNQNVQVIFLSAQAEMEVAVNALKFGAFDYIEKTQKSAMTCLLVILERAIETQRKKKINQRHESIKKWFLIQ